MVNRNPWGAKEDADGSKGVLLEAGFFWKGSGISRADNQKEGY